MPRKSASKRTNPVKADEVLVLRATTSNKKKRNKGAKRAKRRAAPIPTPFLNYVKLISDPCNGPVMSAISTAGAIAERARVVLPTLSSSSTCGYVAWFPSYVSTAGPSSAQETANLFFFEGTSASTRPLNSVASPMGANLTGTGIFIKDPATSFVSASSPFSRQRTLSACMQLEFLGKLSDLSGQVCVVKNISLSALDMNTGAPGHIYTPMSVDEVFAYGAERERTQAGGHEVVWRPSGPQCVFRTNGSESYGSLVTNSAGELADVCWITGTSNTIQTQERTPVPADVNGIIIAWKGFHAGAGLTQISCVKTFELELAPRSGAIETIPRAMTSMDSASIIAKATEWLDTQSPGWQSRLMNAGIDVVGSYAMAVGPRIMRSVTAATQNRRRMLRDL